jgi:hypothetical protein
MSDISHHVGTDQDGFSAMARQACQLLAQQTDLLKNVKLSDQQRAEYMVRQGQIRALILAIGRDPGKRPWMHDLGASDDQPTTQMNGRAGASCKRRL